MKAFAGVLLAGAAWGGINAWTPLKTSVILPAGRQGVLQGTGWNTWTYRSASRSLLFYDRYVGEGLPNTIYGNALTSWDPAAGRVEVLTISDTSPLERHTYEAFAYVGGEDAVYMVSGATRGCGSDAKLWRYSFASKAWEALAGGLPEHYGCEVHLIHWSAGKALILIDGWNKVMHYDLDRGAWSSPPVARSAGVDVYGAKSAWDAGRGRWVFWGGNNGEELAAYNPAAGTFALLPSHGTRPVSRAHMGIAHLPKADAYMVPGAGAPAGQTSLHYSAEADRIYLLDACQGCMGRMELEYRPEALPIRRSPLDAGGSPGGPGTFRDGAGRAGPCAGPRFRFPAQFQVPPVFRADNRADLALDLPEPGRAPSPHPMVPIPVIRGVYASESRVSESKAPNSPRIP